MGRPTTDSQTSISHFSHSHPLQLLNHQTLLGLSHVSCSGCNLEAPDSIYGCLGCNYFLHQKCSQLPSRITHPFDQQHEFTLLPKPKYPEGLFSCDACGKQGRGFCYHCEACGKDLHTHCASLPMLLTHHCHRHELSLTFSPPYPNKTFHCDLCKKAGSNLWLYRCSTCEFDVHLSCVTTMAGASRARPSLPTPSPSQAPYPAGITNHANPTAAFGLQQPSLQNPLPHNFFHNPSPAFPGSFQPNIGIAHPQLQPQPTMGMPYTARPPMINTMLQQQALVQQQQAAFAQQQAMIQQYAQQALAQQQAMMQQVLAQQQSNMLKNSFAEGIGSGIGEGLTQVFFQGLFGGNGGGGNNEAAGGGVAFMGFGGADATAYDGGLGGVDGGGGGGGSY